MDKLPNIEKIWWQRNCLFLMLSFDPQFLPCLSQDLGEVVEFQKSQDFDTCVYKLNITNAGGRHLLNRGIWRIADSKTHFSYIPSDEVLDNIENYTRSFPFTGGDKLYFLQFYVSRKSGCPRVNIKSDFYRKSKFIKRDKLTVSLRRKPIGLIYNLFSLIFHAKPNNVLFYSENSEELGGNAQRLFDRMIERGIDDDFNITIRYTDRFSNHFQGFRIFRHIKDAYVLSRQSFVFIEDYCPTLMCLNLRKQTKLVQLWHAGYGFKAVGFKRFGISGSPNPWENPHNRIDFAAVGNGDLKETYSEVFGVEEDCLIDCGMARLEKFLDEQAESDAKTVFNESFPQFAGRKVILFAPTYRGGSQKKANYPSAKIDFFKFASFCRENNACVVFKMHRFIKKKFLIPSEFSDCMVDASKQDLNSLMYSADVLVTDYSSCFYDFLLLDKPVVFYCYDRAYYSATRGVQDDVRDVAPGPIAENFDELIVDLKKSLSERSHKQPKKMLIDRARYGNDLASDIIIDRILFGEKEK